MTDADVIGDRESAVLDRIEAFRRRRPRMTDTIVTLAHGAGGKASAALVEAVFLAAFRSEPDSEGDLALEADIRSDTAPLGDLVAIVAADEADAALAAMRAHPFGGRAAAIGEIVGDPPGIVVLRTGYGGTRIVDVLVGDPLPRIC